MARLFMDEDVPETEVGSVIRLPPTLWKRLARIAQLETEKAQAVKERAKAFSRNAVIRRVLSDFADAYEAEEAKRQPPKKGH